VTISSHLASTRSPLSGAKYLNKGIRGSGAVLGL
jgi:hypothetical protein